MYYLKPVTINILNEISHWTYDHFFPDFDLSFYFESYRKDPNNLEGPGGCKGYAVFDVEERLMALYEYYFNGKNMVSIGFAVNPAFTNKGLGKGILIAGIQHLKKTYNYTEDYVYLSVSSDNTPAIKLYKKCNFKIYEHELSENGKVMEYKMMKKI